MGKKNVFIFEETEFNETKIIFNKFTKNFLFRDLGNNWNNLFNKDFKKWEKINPWDLWEDGTCFYKYKWDKKLIEIISYLNLKKIKKHYIIGLGHSDPFIEIMEIYDFKIFIENKCITKNNFYWLEGLILTENENIAFGSNHDGDILLFTK